MTRPTLLPRSTPFRRAAVSIGAITLALALTAAGCDDESEPATTTTAAPTTTTSAAEGTAAADTSNAGQSSPVSTPASEEVSQLTGVDISRQGDVDRVVFTFDGDIPGYNVSYWNGGIPTGEEGANLALTGASAVKVSFELASTVELTGGMTKTYTGPAVIDPTDTTQIQQVAQASDFEGVLTWGIGLRSDRQFTVTTEQGPSRVIVDFGTA